MDKKTYNEKVKQTAPKTDELRTLIPAFLVGGLICSIGEGFKDLYAYLFPVLKEAEVGSAVSATMIFLGALITAVGLYDKIGSAFLDCTDSQLSLIHISEPTRH